MTWTIREGSPADFDALRELYRDVWGYIRPRDFDYWRYVSPPEGFCPMALAVAGSRLAGAYSLWPTRVRVGGKVVLGAQSIDTMTHPDFQGQGVFTALANACFELAAHRGYRLLYGFPNPSSYPGFVRRLGFPHVADVTHWVRPIRPSRHPRVPRALAPLADRAMFLWPGGRSNGIEVSAGLPASSTLEALLEQHCVVDSCRIERTPTWFAWRYAEAAHNGYRWLSGYREGRLVALGAWGMRAPAWGGLADGRAHVVELLGGDSDALEAVLAAIIEDVHVHGALLLETLCNEPQIQVPLRRCGFIRHRQAPLIVKSLAEQTFEIDVFAPASWRVMGGDVDTF